MVSSRDFGILALLGIGAFFLFNRASADPFEGQATGQSLEVAKALQSQFDEIGNELESRDELLEQQSGLLKDLQNFINNFLNPMRGGQSAFPSAQLGAGQAPFTKTSTGRDIIVATFGKVPSNFVQGPRNFDPASFTNRRF